MKSIYLLVITLGLISISCEEIFLEDQVENTPTQNFNLFWNEFDQHYALFEVKNIDWGELYDHYNPQVSDQMSSSELWSICTKMLATLDDSHTFLLSYENGKFFLSGDSSRNFAEQEFSRKLVRESYLDSEYKLGKDTAVTYGRIAGQNLGYIHFSDMKGDHPEEINEIVKNLADTDGLIVDLRNNGGGDDAYSQRAAAAFADGKHFIYTVQTKNGPAHDDFDEKTRWYAEPKGDFQYLKPIILLTDRRTISAGEIFCFNMRSFSHVTHIGDNTAGAQSDLSPLRHLPNGWVYGFSYQLYLDPAGESFEGKGFTPDIKVKNKPEDLLNGKDQVLEYAINYLLD